MNKRLFRKLSLRLSACLALRSGRTVCPHGLIKQRKGAALVERFPVLYCQGLLGLVFVSASFQLISCEATEQVVAVQNVHTKFFQFILYSISRCTLIIGVQEETYPSY